MQLQTPATGSTTASSQQKMAPRPGTKPARQQIKRPSQAYTIGPDGHVMFGREPSVWVN